MQTECTAWIEEFPAAITVTDTLGTILAMNGRARETFAKEGGGALIGYSVFDCHRNRPSAAPGSCMNGRGPITTRSTNRAFVR